ncbi:MAG: hypothetical protein HN948_09490 [Clostridia bacterium]|jgi:hypothetical protein|nr:hypothetical protein [Clostridia bacterium]MBT7123225.1 hypothetical protein [Clostridia bacterium]
MSEKKAADKRKILMYVIAAAVILAIAWVILRGMNVFRYVENYDNAIETTQEANE